MLLTLGMALLAAGLGWRWMHLRCLIMLSIC